MRSKLDRTHVVGSGCHVERRRSVRFGDRPKNKEVGGPSTVSGDEWKLPEERHFQLSKSKGEQAIKSQQSVFRINNKTEKKKRIIMVFSLLEKINKCTFDFSFG